MSDPPKRELPSVAQIERQARYWYEKGQEIRAFDRTTLPQNPIAVTIRPKIRKLLGRNDLDSTAFSNEALTTVAFATELFVAELLALAQVKMKENSKLASKAVLTKSDIVDVLPGLKHLDFLIDLYPNSIGSYAAMKKLELGKTKPEAIFPQLDQARLNALLTLDPTNVPKKPPKSKVQTATTATSKALAALLSLPPPTPGLDLPTSANSGASVHTEAAAFLSQMTTATKFDDNPTLENLLCIFATEVPNIREVVLNIYLWGSRVYGTANAASDWDFNVIIKDTGPRGPQVKRQVGDIEKRFRVLDGYNINATFIPLRDWIAMLREHRHEALECYYVDKKHVWMETFKYELRIDPDVLRRTAGWESKRRYLRSDWTSRNESLKRGKKEIVHACRYIQFALQIFDKGRIVDYSVANQLYDQVMNDTNEDIHYYQKKFEPYRKSLSDKLGTARNFSRFYGSLLTKAMAISDARLSRNVTFSPDGDAELKAAGSVDHPLAVVRYARQFGLNKLISENKVGAMFHSMHPNLVFLASADFDVLNTEIEQECCNGVLVDKANQYKVVSYSFGATPSLRETPSLLNSFPWSSTTRIFDKIDATHITLYQYCGKWHIATRFDPEAKLMKLAWFPNMHLDFKVNVATHFWELWKELGYKTPPVDPSITKCYTFQYIYYPHRYAVRYEKSDIILVGARDTATMAELDVATIAPQFGWKTPSEFKFSSLQEVAVKCDTLDPMRAKGFVVWDPSTQRRVKVLNENYIALKLLPDLANIGSLNLAIDMDEGTMFDLIKQKSAQTFLAYFPFYRPYYDEIRAKTQLDEFMDYVQTVYARARLLSKDAFAEATYKFFCSHMMFRAHQGCYPSMAMYLGTLDSSFKNFATIYKDYLRRMANNIPFDEETPAKQKKAADRQKKREEAQLRKASVETKPSEKE